LVHKLALLFWVIPVACSAAVLDLPRNATKTLETASGADSLLLPNGPFANSTLSATKQEGQIVRQAWRVDAAGVTTLQLITPLRDQLVEAGYDVLFDCKDTACGGFDFRYALNVLPAPDMFVNLGDFRFLSARKDDAAFTLLVSRTSTAGYIQISRVSNGGASEPIAQNDSAPARKVPISTPQSRSLVEALDTDGFGELSDLVFQTGSPNLGEGSFASLQTLAEYLLGQPDLKVALVGHTDSEGSLDGNIALSKRRAGSVLERLVTQYGVPRSQVAAEGMGYLSPIANNRTEDGRRANRRVEVIVTSTQ